MRPSLKTWRVALAGTFFALFLFVIATARPQSPQHVSIAPEVGGSEINPNRGASALWQSLQKLHTRASLIMVTAHPDDEAGSFGASLRLYRDRNNEMPLVKDIWEYLESRIEA